jgi:hypothetical protein
MGLRANKNSGAAPRLYARRESDAQAVNKEPKENKKMGQRNRIAVLAIRRGQWQLILRRQKSQRRSFCDVELNCKQS